MAKHEREGKGESKGGIGSLIALTSFSLALGVASFGALRVAGGLQEFADEARFVEAEVNLVEGWMSGGDVRTWNYKAALTFTAERTTVAGETSIDEETFTRLSREGTAQKTNALSKRRRFAIEPGRATLTIQYLPSDPERFENATWEPQPHAMRMLGHILLVLAAVLGFFAAVSAIMLISRRRSRAPAEGVDETV